MDKNIGNQPAASQPEAESAPGPVPGQEEAIDQAALAALFERHGLPEPQRVEPMSGGEVNGMLLVDGEMVVRFNRRDPELPKLEKEAHIYRRLQRATDVPCPDVLALDPTRDQLPYDVLILRRVTGMDGARVWQNLDEAAREHLSEEVGRICGAIHGLQWLGYGDYNVETGTFGEFARWTDMLLARLQAVAEQALATGALPQPIIDGIITELNDGDSVLETASPPVLVHGDLHPGNLVLDQSSGAWHIATIVDWEWSLATDAAWEFADLAARPPSEGLLLDAFLYGYRERHPVQGDLRSRIHLYRLLLHLERAERAHRRHPDAPEHRLAEERALRRLLRRGRGVGD
jgi:aminoglycoside phosphotransferase (APT) family kinase protein